ncbi:hypothetical protein BO70DRAFT_158252 [Aspergillus heteromorphus CBS 117.55]|uniref:Myb-like DNA-binding domain-containing protein n=1 Tax=Aspergillus heteromorphus CBS 117.55 TaxID=1448321 RepID=A0A317WUM5_9EURO|nr:uncharacterized protein BO70DRAFT_158252 [Aspergillus heteromorphus CBS 117.55]PWY89002.1 hypothetical protein BO70DRAFT_158252 [Aspergillus heteromorphus CBS 117.55]
MPPKLAVPDTNTLFLYVCLLKSDFTSVDWKAVTAATDLNENAARMRFSRLKKRLEAFVGADGKVDVKRGEPAAESSAASTPASTPVKKQGAKGGKANLKRPGDDDAADTSSSAKKKKPTTKGKKKVVKPESDDDETVDLSDHGSASQDNDDASVKEE